MERQTWNVFPDDMGLDDSVELALANMDLNDLVLEPVTFDDESEYLEGSSSTATNVVADLGLGIEEEDGIESDAVMVIMTWRRTRTIDRVMSRGLVAHCLVASTSTTDGNDKL